MRNKTLALAILGLLVLATSSCSQLEARDNLLKGMNAFKASHYEAAIGYFQETLKLDPNVPNGELYLATAYSQQFIPHAPSPENQKNADMAMQTFQHILEKDPNNAGAIAGLASLYQNTDQFQKAHYTYLKQTQVDATNPVPFYAIGSVNWIIVFDKASPPPPEQQLKLVDEGLASLDKALQLNPDYDDAMSYKNLLLREKARLSESEDEKKKLNEEADVWFNKALETRKKIQEKKRGPGGITMDAPAK